MKRLLFAVFMGMGIVGANAQMISSFPYQEDFESGPGNWVSSGTNDSWEFGVPNDNFINGPGPCGDSSWVTNLTADYNNSEDSQLESPMFDFTALTNDPILRFDHIYQTEACCDEGWVEYSTNGGTTWTKLGTSGSGINWYNDSGNDWWDGTSGAAGVWRIAAHPLTGTAGEDSVMVRFRFDSDGSVNEDGFGVDNIIIAETLEDITPTALVAPGVSGAFGATEMVTVTVTNAGTDTLTSIDLCFSVDNGAQVCETFTTSLAPAASLDYTFVGTADLSGVGAHTIEIVGDLAGDAVACNDTLVATVTTLQIITSFPYVEEFEANDGGWIASGASSSWAYGMPNAPFITESSNCGDNAWVTNLTGDYNNNESSVLESPIFDCSGFSADPILRFDHIYETESCCDEGWVEISLDSGNTWNKLGTSATGINWYNDAGNDWWDGTSGNAGEWRIAAHEMTGAAGVSGVMVRFVFDSDGSSIRDGFGVDNILVFETLADAAPLGLVTPTGAAPFGANETVEVTVANTGNDTIFSLDICFEVDNGGFTCETFTTTIAPGIATNLTFTGTANLSGVGSHDITIVTDLTADAFACNDTSVFQVTTLQVITSYPYTEDFEATDGGWTTNGTNNSWEWGMPAGPFIDASSPCGDSAWVTNLTGDYNSGEDSFLESPIFDFSGLTDDPVLRFDHIYRTESCCDEGWVDISLDGGATWNKLGVAGSGINWYNDAGNDWWDGNTGNAGEWRTALHELTGAAGVSNVKVRFAFDSDGSVQEDGFGVDNIVVDQTVANTNVIAMANTGLGCNLDSNSAVTVSVLNNGLDSIFSVPVCYTVNGGAAVCETFMDTIAPGDTLDVTFTSLANLGAAGVYGLAAYTTTDFFNCGDTLLDTVTNVVVVGSVTNTTLANCFGEASGSATMGVTGNLGTVNYAWSTGDSTMTAMNLLAAAYTVVITDSTSGCTDTVDVSIGQPPALTASFDTTDVICNGDANGSVTANVTGGTMGYSYLWSNGDTTAMISNLMGGTYTATVTDANGCTFTAAQTLIDPVAINLLANSTDVSCEGLSDGSVDATANGGWGVFGYVWDDPNNSMTGIVNNLPAGTYNVTATDDNGCTETAMVTVNDGLPILQVELGVDTTICAGDTLVLDAGNAGASFAWSTGETTQTIELTDSATVSVIVSDNGFCDGTDEIVVDVQVCPGIDELKAAFDATFYPNPTNGELNLQLNGLTGENVNVTIMNVSGQVQQDFQLNGLDNAYLHTFDLSGLAPGIYLVHLSSATKSTVARITLH